MIVCWLKLVPILKFYEMKCMSRYLEIIILYGSSTSSTYMYFLFSFKPQRFYAILRVGLFACVPSVNGKTFRFDQIIFFYSRSAPFLKILLPLFNAMHFWDCALLCCCKGVTDEGMKVKLFLQNNLNLNFLNSTTDTAWKLNSTFCIGRLKHLPLSWILIDSRKWGYFGNSN